MAKNKDCWEWISNKIEKAETKLKKPNLILLTFFVFKDGTVTYVVGTIAATQEYPIDFTPDEISECKSKAEANGLQYDVIDQPDDDPIQVISFRKFI